MIKWIKENTKSGVAAIGGAGIAIGAGAEKFFAWLTAV